MENTFPASVSLSADGTELGYAELPYPPTLKAGSGAWHRRRMDPADQLAAR
jgi:hypothetical protein